MIFSMITAYFSSPTIMLSCLETSSTMQIIMLLCNWTLFRFFGKIENICWSNYKTYLSCISSLKHHGLALFLLSFLAFKFPTELSTAPWFLTQSSQIFHIPPINKFQKPKDHMAMFISAVFLFLEPTFNLRHFPYCCDKIPWCRKGSFWLTIWGWSPLWYRIQDSWSMKQVDGFHPWLGSK